MKSSFAFITYKRTEDADRAVRELNRQEFEGRELIVE